MEKLMRAKMCVYSVKRHDFKENPNDSYEKICFASVCSDETFGEKGESENNTFARFTPNAALDMNIANPDLLGKLKAGDEYYVDFTLAKKQTS